MVVSGTPFVGFPTEAWLLFAAMTAGPQFLGHTVFNHLLGEVKASVVSVALLAEPVGVHAASALLVFHERPGPQVVAGAAVVLAGVQSLGSPSRARAPRCSRAARGRVATMPVDRPVTIEEWEAAARQALPVGVFDYIAGGAGGERTLAANVAAFDRWTVWPSMLRASGEPDPSTSVLGTPFAFPVVDRPLGVPMAGARRRGTGDRARRRDARGADVRAPRPSLTGSRTSRRPATALWWQLYIWRDRDATADLLRARRRRAIGALVWTVDVPSLGRRHRDTRNGYALPIGPGGSPQEFESNLSWNDLALDPRARAVPARRGEGDPARR